MANVIINGANRGIGLSLVQKFLSEGHDVWALCRTSSPDLRSTKATIVENIDVTDESSLENLKEKLPSEVHIAINNAGILIGDNFQSFNSEDLLQQYKVNSLGPTLFIRSIKELLITGSKVGIVTSRMGSISDNTSGSQYGYRMSKAAANAAGMSMAQDFKSEGITVLILHPGYVQTDMTGGKGLIDTKESADGLYNLLTTKDIHSTGKFFHTNSEELPW